MRFLGGFVPELWRFLDSEVYVRPILTPNRTCYKLLYLFFGLRYSLQTLRDDRLGQNSTLVFYGVVPNSATRRRGGAQSEIHVLAKTEFCRTFFFQIFWVFLNPWVKIHIISKNWRGVFCLTHFRSRNVNEHL